MHLQRGDINLFMSCEKPIAILPDIDGSLQMAPTSFVSGLRMYLGQSTLTPEQRAEEKFGLLDKMQTLFYRHQPAKKDSLEGLIELLKIGEDTSRQTEVAVMSARSNKHMGSTREGLNRSGFLDYIDIIHLKGFQDLFRWRNEIVNDYLERDFHVVVIEDDTDTARKMAKANEEGTLVYTFRNSTNLFLRQKNMPENLIFVRTLKDAAKDVREKVESGSF
jgi:hypothetical protein